MISRRKELVNLLFIRHHSERCKVVWHFARGMKSNRVKIFISEVQRRCASSYYGLKVCCYTFCFDRHGSYSEFVLNECNIIKTNKQNITCANNTTIIRIKCNCEKMSSHIHDKARENHMLLFLFLYLEYISCLTTQFAMQRIFCVK